MKIPSRPLLALLLTSLLLGCVSSSGVVPAGQDTYMISTSRKGFQGASGPVKAAALKEADEFCRKRGKVMMVLRTSRQDMKVFKSDATAEVYFKALDPNDPQLKQPPSTIEIRN